MNDQNPVTPAAAELAACGDRYIALLSGVESGALAAARYIRTLQQTCADLSLSEAKAMVQAAAVRPEISFDVEYHSLDNGETCSTTSLDLVVGEHSLRIENDGDIAELVDCNDVETIGAVARDLSLPAPPEGCSNDEADAWINETEGGYHQLQKFLRALHLYADMVFENTGSAPDTLTIDPA